MVNTIRRIILVGVITVLIACQDRTPPQQQEKPHPKSPLDSVTELLQKPRVKQSPPPPLPISRPIKEEQKAPDKKSGKARVPIYTPDQDVPWPPVLGKRYPDLTLFDQNGQSIQLSTFKGKVVLVQLITLNCPACQAYAGGNTRGGIGGVIPQPNLKSIDQYFPIYAKKMNLGDSRLRFVQIILSNMKGETPTVNDAKEWMQHFPINNVVRVVLVASRRMHEEGTTNLVPGFQLIDKNFILRYDASGRAPRHDLFRQLLPAVSQLVVEGQTR